MKASSRLATELRVPGLWYVPFSTAPKAPWTIVDSGAHERCTQTLLSVLWREYAVDLTIADERPSGLPRQSGYPSGIVILHVETRNSGPAAAATSLGPLQLGTLVLLLVGNRRRYIGLWAALALSGVSQHVTA